MIEKLLTVVLTGFDARYRDYIKKRKQWRETSEEGRAVGLYNRKNLKTKPKPLKTDFFKSN